MDPTDIFSDSCEPLAQVPSWWAGFLFRVLTPRQMSLYLYLSLISSETGTCQPTTKQIRQDLGLTSLTIVFEAISALEDRGFILRQRKPDLRSRRNVYQRPSCEFTILRLIERSCIDATLRPIPSATGMTSASSQLRDHWLSERLSEDYVPYLEATGAAKRALLIGALRRLLAGG
jgi:SOS-response transcriptional repressor LexA